MKIVPSTAVGQGGDIARRKVYPCFGHWLLSTPGFTTVRSRLDAFDPETGHLLRSAQLNTTLPTIGVDSDGRVYLLDATRLLTGVTPRERETFPRIVLATSGGDTVTTESFRGRVTLVNVWASWCTICHVEMPALVPSVVPSATAVWRS